MDKAKMSALAGSVRNAFGGNSNRKGFGSGFSGAIDMISMKRKIEQDNAEKGGNEKSKEIKKSFMETSDENEKENIMSGDSKVEGFLEALKKLFDEKDAEEADQEALKQALLARKG